MITIESLHNDYIYDVTFPNKQPSKDGNGNIAAT